MGSTLRLTSLAAALSPGAVGGAQAEALAIIQTQTENQRLIVLID
jgi:hypothetical protein